MHATSSDLDAWLGKARLGQLSNEDCERLTTMGYMDVLRLHVTEHDLDWILPDILKYSDERGALQINLTSRFATRDDVKALLRDSWPEANVHQKSHLLWRILDDPELPDWWHSQLFEFVQEEWDQFQRTCSHFYGGTPEGMVAGTVNRYLNPSVPQSKKWAYVCNLATVQDYPFVVDFFLQQASQSGDEFESRVAVALKARR